MTDADGRLVVAGEIAVISFERRLRSSTDAVWAALTDPAQFAAWLGPGTLEPRAGGQVSIATGPEGGPERRAAISGTVLVWDPPAALEYEWAQPGLPVSTVRYELEAAGNDTILRLTHRRSVGAGIGGRAGWHAYLDRLAAHLGGGPIPAWSVRRSGIQGAYGEGPVNQTQ
ncbi:MAG: SRPBCC family protein [Phycisphaerales bacterium]|nr:SRPBCC family protein [Phycisphaerales bacterium]